MESLPIWPGNDYHLFSTDGGRRQIKGYSKAKARLDTEMLKLMRKDNEEATLVPFRVHDFRTTCQTRLAALGFSPDVFGAVLGHAKPGLQRTYNKHEYLDEKRAAMRAYGEHIAGTVR
jgi:integrase